MEEPMSNPEPDETPLAPLKLLPREQWYLRPCDAKHFGVMMSTREVDGVAYGYMVKWSVFDFPNNFFSIEDLKLAGLFGIYMAAVRELKDRSAAIPLRPAAV